MVYEQWYSFDRKVVELLEIPTIQLLSYQKNTIVNIIPFAISFLQTNNFVLLYLFSSF